MTNHLFDNFVKEKLSNYSSAVPDDMWSKIQAKKEKRRGFFFWTNKKLISSITLIILLGTILYSLKNTTTLNNTTSEKLTTTENTNTNPINEEFNKSLVNETNTSIPEPIVNEQNKTATLTNPVLNSISFNNVSKIQNAENSINSSGEIIVNEDEKENFSAQLKFEKLNLTTFSLRNFNQKFSTQNLKSKSSFYNSIDDCPSVRGILKNDLFIEVYASPDYVQKMSNSGLTGSLNYLKRKDSSENTIGSYTAGIRLSKTLGEHFVLKSGIQYSQVNEKFNYVNENEIRFITVVTIRTIIRSPGDTLFLRDTSLVQQQGTRVKTTYNKYRSLDIPLILGYEWGGEKIRISVNAGIILNLRSWQTGETLDTSYVPAAFNSKQGLQFKRNIGLGLYAGLSIIKKVSKNAEIFFEPYYRKNLGNMTENGSVFQQKFNTTGISLGFRYKLKGFGQQYQGK